MKKLLFLAGLFFSAFLFLYSGKAAAQNKFVTIINPIRGKDFWDMESQELLDWHNFYQQNIYLPSTWLLRPDFLFDQKIEIDDNQELGLFLEVTPSWAKRAEVNYQQGAYWSQSPSIFLSGYSREERQELIKSAFEIFKKNYGHYPQTVGAWHVDPFSAKFMKENYDIKAVLICADQYKTDSYQIWGGWWGVPYYPRQSNLLMPADKNSPKLDVVILQWAVRDPLNGYGSSVKESIYSVQVNDYLQHDLTVDYFGQLADFYLNPAQGEFGHLTVGIENGYSLPKYKNEYQQIISNLEDKQVEFVTAAEFSNWYQDKYDGFSPSHKIGGSDPLGTGIQAYWEMTNTYRKGTIKKAGQAERIRDFRSYKLYWPDPYLWNRNLGGDLYWNIPASVDAVKNPNADLPTETEFDLGDQITVNFPISNFKWLLFAIPIIGLIYYLTIKKRQILLIFIPASIIFSIPLLTSGRLYYFGLGFWGANGHDALWHIGLMQQLKKLKFINPAFNGARLVNYHWGSDLIMAISSRILSLTIWDAYFRFFPLILASLIVVLSYYWGYEILKNKRTGIIFGLLNFFAGSMGWVYTLVQQREIGGESLFWSMQSISTLINMPFAFSLVGLLVFVFLWKKAREKNNFKLIFPLTVLLGSLVVIKIYAAILLGLSLFFLMIWSGLTKKKEFKFDLVLVAAGGVLSLVFMYLLGLFDQASVLQFQPLWFTRSLIESIDKLYYPKLAGLRHNLSQLNWSLKKLALIPLELILIGIFIIGNFGFRLLGIGFRVLKQRFVDLDVVLGTMLLLSILFPLLFVQKGTAWNTIQFLYYGLFIANFYFAGFLNNLLDNQRYIIFSLICLLTIPTTIGSLRNYLSYPAHSHIPYYELQGLEELKNKPSGKVLSYPFDSDAKQGVRTPIPSYLYVTNLYLSAYTGHVSYLADEMNLEITGYRWEDRKKEVLEFFGTDDKIWARGFLLNNEIDYIYLVNDQEMKLQPGDLSLKEFFDNGLVRIYQVEK